VKEINPYDFSLEGCRGPLAKSEIEALAAVAETEAMGYREGDADAYSGRCTPWNPELHDVLRRHRYVELIMPSLDWFGKVTAPPEKWLVRTTVAGLRELERLGKLPPELVKKAKRKMRRR
jgi:hypothetical protein